MKRKKGLPTFIRSHTGKLIRQTTEYNTKGYVGDRITISLPADWVIETETPAAVFLEHTPSGSIVAHLLSPGNGKLKWTGPNNVTVEVQFRIAARL